MKKIILFLFMILLIINVTSQVPQAFKYQAVARDTAGVILANKTVAIRIWILQGTATGNPLYRERHTTTSNEYGLINIEIGRGTPQLGTFAGINWSTGPMFLKVELDPEGGYGYYFMGTSELLSVPFALYSRGSSGTTSLSDADSDTKIQVEKNPDEDIIRFDLGGAETMTLFSKRLELNNSGNNVLFGKTAGFMNTSGYSNVGIGTGTLFNSTSQSNLVAIGDSALFKNGIGASGGFNANKNTAIGSKALLNNTTGAWNTAVGFQSLYSNTTGLHNSAFGYKSLYRNNDGMQNTAMGEEALIENTIGTNNTAIGYRALYSSNSCYENTAIGTNSLHSNVDGEGNVAIGSGAGYWETGSNKLFIDNQGRTNEQAARENALIYGEFAMLAINQKLTINGMLRVNGWTEVGGLITEGSITTGGSLHVNGWTTTEVLQITGTQGLDLAEIFEISEYEELKPGSVVVIDENNPGALKLSKKPYDPLVAGVLSGAGGLEPGVTLGQFDSNILKQFVALSGRVYVLATAENGIIKPGDMLTTSSTPGYAMKATDSNLCDGAVIGKAMSSLDEGEGLVLILINLH